MTSLFVKLDGRYKGLLFSEICYVEGCKNYVRIHTEKKVYTVHHTLRQIEEHLPGSQFCRIQKSYIVSLDRLMEFDRESVWLCGVQLPLSPQYIGLLKSKLNVVSAEKRTLSLPGKAKIISAR